MPRPSSDGRMLAPVRFGPAEAAPPDLPAQHFDGVPAALRSASALAATLPSPGEGSTAVLWSALATVAAHDLEAARAIEPHLDAVAILRQATVEGLPAAGGPAGTWGVFAAEGGEPLLALPDGDGWILDGTKPWCSLAGVLDAALITATLPDGGRRLFAIDLGARGVHVRPAVWHARGLTAIPSGPVELKRVPAEPVGPAGWYLARDGFHWGGIGVAACWFGGLVGLARDVAAAVARHPDRDLVAMHLGAIDTSAWAASRCLEDAAQRIDDGRATGAAGRLLAKRVRAVVAAACEDAIVRAGHALGPASLALDAEHAKRIADLQLYIRQHHAEADLASLGREVGESGSW